MSNVWSAPISQVSSQDCPLSSMLPQFNWLGGQCAGAGCPKSDPYLQFCLKYHHFHLGPKLDTERVRYFGQHVKPNTWFMVPCVPAHGRGSCGSHCHIHMGDTYETLKNKQLCGSGNVYLTCTSLNLWNTWIAVSVILEAALVLLAW